MSWGMFHARGLGAMRIHIVTTVGLASALISFATLERRALRDA